MKYLLDTCVISEFIKIKPNENLISWISIQNLDDFGISVITFGEIWKGICMLSNSEKKNILKIWFENEVLKLYKSRSIPIDFSVMITWGEQYAKLEMKKLQIPAVDLLISATAIEHNLILVTRNVKDFINTDCKILNPWENTLL